MLRFFVNNKIPFSKLTQREILALAISSEEEDSRTYRELAMRISEKYPGTSKILLEMSSEENEHRIRLLDLYSKRFGQELPKIVRSDIQGFRDRVPLWLNPDLSLNSIRNLATDMEKSAAAFYKKAMERTQDVEIRTLLGDLAIIEENHSNLAVQANSDFSNSQEKSQEDIEAHKALVLQVVQPGLAGLIDGSVSTLAPIFATAFATQNSHTTFLVGLATSIGAGISMGITEAMSDDGKVSGRGSPWLRGIVCGLATMAGGLGHALPYLIHDFWTATAIALVIVVLELIGIAWLRWKFMGTEFHQALLQIVLGGLIVMGIGILIGSG